MSITLPTGQYATGAFTLFGKEVGKPHVRGLRKEFFWWCSGQECSCQCRGHRFDPWSGKTPQPSGQAHAQQRLCLGAASPAACAPRACALLEKRQNEKSLHHNEEWPPPPQLEKARVQEGRPSTTKNKV